MGLENLLKTKNNKCMYNEDGIQSRRVLQLIIIISGDEFMTLDLQNGTS